MIQAIDLLRSARILVKQHGDDAELIAAIEADRHLSDGRLDGARLWRAIAVACAFARYGTNCS